MTQKLQLHIFFFKSVNTSSHTQGSIINIKSTIKIITARLQAETSDTTQQQNQAQEVQKQ